MPIMEKDVRNQRSLIVHRYLLKGKIWHFRGTDYVMKNRKLYVKETSGDYLVDVTFNAFVEMCERMSGAEIARITRLDE